MKVPYVAIVAIAVVAIVAGLVWYKGKDLSGGSTHKCIAIDGSGPKIKMPAISNEIKVWSINNNQEEYLCLVNNLPFENSSKAVKDEWNQRFQRMVTKARGDRSY